MEQKMERAGCSSGAERPGVSPQRGKQTRGTFYFGLRAVNTTLSARELGVWKWPRSRSRDPRAAAGTVSMSLTSVWERSPREAEGTFTPGECGCVRWAAPGQQPQSGPEGEGGQQSHQRPVG